MGVVRFAAAAMLGLMALMAVFYISDDSSTSVAESMTTSTEQSSDKLPETVDSFLETAVQKRESMDAFNDYKIAMETAEKKASKAKFQAAKRTCKLLRVGSYKKCAISYCAGMKTCGTPCKTLFGQPPQQVVPIAGPKRFYKVAAVRNKELKAKEGRAKEQDMKEAKKKEGKVKEGKYKAKIAREKKTKENATKVRDAKEKVKKEKDAKERQSKENAEKGKEAAHKAGVLLKCSDDADRVKATCVVKKIAEKQQKAIEAEEAKKAALQAVEMQQKKDREANTTYASDSQEVYYASAAKHVTSIADYASAAYASGKAEETDNIAEADNADAAIESYNSAVVAALANAAPGTSEEEVKPILDGAVMKEVTTDKDFADSVIPPGGQLLQVSLPDIISPTEAEMNALAAKIQNDNTQLATNRAGAAEAVRNTQKAENLNTNAANAFNTADTIKKSEDNLARLHAGKAALDMSKVSAVDSYVSTHRGVHHMTTCAEEKKFSFDVCFGRAEYKGQLFQTKKAKESRTKSDEYKAIMGKDYANVIKTNTTLVDSQRKATQAEKAVKMLQKHLEEAKASLEDGRHAIKEAKAKKAQKEADTAKRAAEKAAFAAMEKGEAAPPAVADASYASAADASYKSGTAAMELYEAEEDLFEEELVEDPDDTVPEEEDEEDEGASFGRQLLSTKKMSKKEQTCDKASHKAHNECETDVNSAYAHCATLYKKVL